MKYIVSGYRRTGTSAMVKALSKGLSERILYAPEREDIPVIDGYQPNPGGIFEIGHGRYKRPEFMRDHLKYDGIIKVFFDGLPALPADDYVIVFMLRSPDEITLSLDRAAEYFVANQQGSQLSQDHGLRNYPFDVFSPYNQDDIDQVLGICEQRNDMKLHIVQYQDLIDVPEAVFARMKRDTIPDLNIYAAAAVINPEYHRSHAPST